MAERADQELQALYVRLYCDEDVSAGVVENLRQRSFDVLSARDADRLHLDDDAQLAFAVAAQRALLTHNRYDFEQQHSRYLMEPRATAPTADAPAGAACWLLRPNASAALPRSRRSCPPTRPHCHLEWLIAQQNGVCKRNGIKNRA